jgi:cold shock CspA family protein
MKPILNKGQIVTWNDDQGFGFIKPDNDSKEVFLHISALSKRVRRPKVGDTVYYKKNTKLDGKIYAAQASIQGSKPHRLLTEQKSRKQSLLKAIMSIVIVGGISLFTIEFTPSRSPSPIQLIAKPECIIKGNISHNTGKKLYHLPGMEDYETTVIDELRGEKWFCSESEAITTGWEKAPK